MNRHPPGLVLAGAVLALAALAAPAAAQEAQATPPASATAARLWFPVPVEHAPPPTVSPQLTPTAVPATAKPRPPAPAAGHANAMGARIALAFLAEIGVLGVALTAGGVYLRARELDLAERELALREREASRRY